MSDLIDRQAAIDVAKDVHNAVLCCEVSPSKSLLEVVKRLESLPSAEPKPGVWIAKRWHNRWLRKCSVCGWMQEIDTPKMQGWVYKFCPNCGIRMIEEGEA